MKIMKIDILEYSCRLCRQIYQDIYVDRYARIFIQIMYIDRLPETIYINRYKIDKQIQDRRNLLSTKLDRQIDPRWIDIKIERYKMERQI